MLHLALWRESTDVDQGYSKARHQHSETRGTTPVHIFRDNFNYIAYCNVINVCLTETADLLYPDGWKLQEDNSSIHKSKLSVSYKEERAIRCIYWPSCSPDLNSTYREFMGCSEERILNRAPKTIEDVKNYVIYYDIEWGTFDQEFIGNFTKSMRKRCDLVLAAQGKKINYLTISYLIVTKWP